MSLSVENVESVNPPSFAVRKKRNSAAYVFMSPWLVGMVFFTAGSMLFTVYLAFTNYDLLSAPKLAGVTS